MIGHLTPLTACSAGARPPLGHYGVALTNEVRLQERDLCLYTHIICSGRQQSYSQQIQQTCECESDASAVTTVNRSKQNPRCLELISHREKLISTFTSSSRRGKSLVCIRMCESRNGEAQGEGNYIFTTQARTFHTYTSTFVKLAARSQMNNSCPALATSAPLFIPLSPSTKHINK